MKPRMSKSILPILLFVAAGVGCAASEVEDKIEKVFDASPGGKIVLDVDRGSIDVKSSDGNAVRIEVSRKAQARSRSRAEDMLKQHQIEFSQEGAEVVVQARNPDQRTFKLWPSVERLEIRYLVTIPQKFSAQLKTRGGSISVDNLEGQVEAKTSGGSLKFGRISGPIVGRTSGGSVMVESCRNSVDVDSSGGSLRIGQVDGSVTARTSGGSIHIRQARGDVLARTSGGSIEVNEVSGRIDASTSGGSVSARLSEQPKGDCALKTSGGTIEVVLPETVGVDLDASSSGGRVTTDFPVEGESERKASLLRTKLNGGGPAMVLHTSGGNVRIRKM